MFSIIKYKEVTKINVNFADLNGHKTCLYFVEWFWVKNREL